jgi:hypothetical protein
VNVEIIFKKGIVEKFEEKLEILKRLQEKCNIHIKILDFVQDSYIEKTFEEINKIEKLYIYNRMPVKIPKELKVNDVELYGLNCNFEENLKPLKTVTMIVEDKTLLKIGYHNYSELMNRLKSLSHLQTININYNLMLNSNKDDVSIDINFLLEFKTVNIANLKINVKILEPMYITADTRL